MPVVAESHPLVDVARSLSEATAPGAPTVVGLDAACAVIDAAERLRRLSAVSLVDVMQSVDRSGVYLDQGHASAKTMVVHLAKLSGGDGFRLDKIRRMVHGCADLIAERWRSGELAIEQAVVLAKVKRVHNLVWQGESAEELFRRWSGETPRPLSPDSAGVTDLDGNPMHGFAAIADLVTGSFRRVVQNASSVVVDMSKDQRFFTGLARLGVELQATECYWHECWLPTSQCQIDHLQPAARGGPTTQDNGGPACPRHNRLNEAGYTVTRLPGGTMRITTPSGEVVR